MHDTRTDMPERSEPLTLQQPTVTTLDVVPVPLCLVDRASGTVLYKNPACDSEFGALVRVGEEFVGLFSPGEREGLRGFLSGRALVRAFVTSLGPEEVARELTVERGGELTLDEPRGDNPGAGADPSICFMLRPVGQPPPPTDTVIAQVADVLPIPFWAIDGSGCLAVWNRAAQKLTGLVQDEACHEGVAGLFGPGGTGRAAPIMSDACKAPARFVLDDGAERWGRWLPLTDAYPVANWSSWGIGLDVTEQHAAVFALHESGRRYRDVIRNAELACIMVDLDSRVLAVNDHFVELGGWDEHAMLGVPWRDALRSCGRDAIDPESLARVLGSDPFEGRVEAQLITASGARRDLIWAQSLIRGADGRVTGVCALGTDITDRRVSESELASHRDRLEELVSQRTAALAASERRLRDAERLASVGQLAAGLGHDLSNMLFPVRCHLDRLARTPLSGEQQTAVGAIQTGLEFLEALGDGLEILAGNASGSGASGARFEPIDPLLWWESVRPLLTGLVPEGVAFVECIGDEAPQIRLPRHLLTRAAMNLVTNAVDAVARIEGTSRRGRIEFRMSACVSGCFRIEVIDNGPGLEPEVMHRAAEPFFTTKTRSLSTGLGLSISKAVAGLAGGTFELVNHDSVGARAVFSVPGEEPCPDHTCAESPRVCVAITDPRTNALCRAVCESLRCTFTEVGSEDATDFVVLTSRDSHRQGGGEGESGRMRVVTVDPSGGFATMRDTIREAFGTRRETS